MNTNETPTQQKQRKTSKSQIKNNIKDTPIKTRMDLIDTSDGISPNSFQPFDTKRESIDGKNVSLRDSMIVPGKTKPRSKPKNEPELTTNPKTERLKRSVLADNVSIPDKNQKSKSSKDDDLPENDTKSHSASTKSKSAATIEDDVSDELQLPTLWIRGVQGQVHLLDTPMTGISITSDDDTKQRKSTSKFRQFYDLSFEKPLQKKKSSHGGTSTYSGLIPENEIFNTIQGVKISCDVDSDITQLKEAEVEQVLQQQQDQLTQDLNQTKNVIKKYEVEKKKEEKKKVVIKRRPIVRNINLGTKLDGPMYHIPQPNLMSPLFELPPTDNIMYGPFVERVRVVEKIVWQKSMFRGPEQLIFGPLH